MANDISSNPIKFDSVGAANFKMPVNGIVVEANADNWAVELVKTGAGLFKTFYKVSQNLVNDRHTSWSPAKPITVPGLYAKTLTNIAQVLVYLDSVE